MLAGFSEGNFSGLNSFSFASDGLSDGQLNDLNPQLVAIKLDLEDGRELWRWSQASVCVTSERNILAPLCLFAHQTLEILCLAHWTGASTGHICTELYCTSIMCEDLSDLQVSGGERSCSY